MSDLGQSGVRAADSPRWCEKCQAWGDHHTDRHPDPSVEPKRRSGDSLPLWRVGRGRSDG